MGRVIRVIRVKVTIMGDYFSFKAVFAILGPFRVFFIPFCDSVVYGYALNLLVLVSEGLLLIINVVDI